MIIKINKGIKTLLVKLSKLYSCEFAIIIVLRSNEEYKETVMLTCSKINTLYNNTCDTNREFESIEELNKFLIYLKEKL